MADMPHAYPPDMSDERLARLRSQLIAHNLPISNINAFTLFALGDTYHPTWIEDDLRLVSQRDGTAILHRNEIELVMFVTTSVDRGQ